MMFMIDRIDTCLTAGIRCTVKLDPSAYSKPGNPQMTGIAVSPAAPREEKGTYWGYTTRLATSMQAVFDECPFEEGYDLKIGTSERGHVSIDDKKYKVPNYKHSLIVFGGVAGIEECVDADESIKVSGAKSFTLFDQWVNVCPYQASRTIRTEEAVLITLAKYSAFLDHAGDSTGSSNQVDSLKENAEDANAETKIDFSDNGLSEESSDEGE